MKNGLLSLFVFSLLIMQKCFAVGLDDSVLRAPVEVYKDTAITLQERVSKKPVYLKFWATWCKPCRDQMPHLQHTYEKYGNEIDIISVNIWINETDNMIESMKKEFGLTMPIALDKNGVWAQAFNFVGTPYHILIDEEGDIVHKGHNADQDLDRKVELLAARSKAELPTLVLQPNDGTLLDISKGTSDVSVLFFTATWCDWYLKESRPTMASACVIAQNTINTVHERLPKTKLLEIVSRLWTGQKDLNEYIKKYDIKHSIAIDESNDAFFALNVKTFPTLIIMKNGKELYRTSTLNSADEITKKIEQLSI